MKHRYLSVIILLLMFSEAFSQDISSETNYDYLVKKGRFYSTLNFSFNKRTAENEDQLLRQVIDQNRYNYRITGNGGYAVIDNLTLGMSLGYGEVKEVITYLDENSVELTSKKLERGFSIAPNMRNYIPLGTGRLQILVQTELGLTFGESLQRIYHPDEIDKIAGNFLEVEFGVSPGMVLFFDKHWAFETTVGIAGFSTRIEEEVKNNDEENRSRTVQTSIDLKINILQLNLGVAYYF